jgi:hypothetical protein
MRPTAFEQFAGLCGILAGISGFLYSVAFIIIARNAPNLAEGLSALFLMLGGVFSTAVLTAVYLRLRETEPAFALWALLLGLAGVIGSAVHGGYNLANAINPPTTTPTGQVEPPNPVDPRGLLTFGFVGLAVLVIAWLIGRGGQFPRGLSYLGYLLGILLVVLYLGRLIVLDARSPIIVVPALLTGFLVNPAWYIWLGLVLWREHRAPLSAEA